MAVPPALVVVVKFDPPVIQFTGPIRDGTVAKLNMILPMLTRNVGSVRRDPPCFMSNRDAAIQNWSMTIHGCLTDEPARMAILYAILKCLEEEGGWKMRDTFAGYEDYTEINTLFFTNGSMK